ncbi:aldo/keto reductase [Marixanthomonas spongiae]|uniref:Alcohol dehydrogenase n=1 Tax=Marixanthomonas spongiae TaxID=2174845 RepID=A0A2U0I3H9_9FLAO|nr:aldo/keto reductase [Marixanthomonas spongiae]PVW15648.1 alcohol dehydrogenase [Marixanthomonas spongiae]
MKKIALGNTQLKISPIIFGGNVFGWTLNEKESFKMLDAIFELGINCIDTADVYSRWYNGNTGGESEKIIGKWMKERGNRDMMVICTKAGMDMGQGGIDISEKHLKKSIDDSLNRLQTDYVDLYYAHKDDESTPPEETLGTFKKLINEKRVRYIGASNFSSERLRQSLLVAEENGLPAYTVYQPEYNLVERSKLEGAIEEVCNDFNLGVATYFSLASGLLTGKYNSQEAVENSSRTDYVKKHWNQKTRSIIHAVTEIAKNHSVSPAAVSLAWLLQNPRVTAPIVSATKKEHLDAFAQAVNLELSNSEMETLNNISA